MLITRHPTSDVGRDVRGRVRRLSLSLWLVCGGLTLSLATSSGCAERAGRKKASAKKGKNKRAKVKPKGEDKKKAEPKKAASKSATPAASAE